LDLEAIASDDYFTDNEEQDSGKFTTFRTNYLWHVSLRSLCITSLLALCGPSGRVSDFEEMFYFDVGQGRLPLLEKKILKK